MFNRSSSSSTTESTSISAPQSAEGSGVNVGVGGVMGGGGSGLFNITTTGKQGKVNIKIKGDDLANAQALDFAQRTLETGFQQSQQALNQAASLAAESTGNMELAQSMLSNGKTTPVTTSKNSIYILIGIGVLSLGYILLSAKRKKK